MKFLRRTNDALASDQLWSEVLASSSLFDDLDRARRADLRDLAIRFCASVHFSGARGFEVTPFVQLSIAAQACLLVLDLGLEHFSEVRTVILYPEAFVAYREEEDDIGIVHSGYEALDGESIEQGAVVLAWEEARPRRHDAPTNLILHEFAHKLDEGTGTCNGVPVLASRALRLRWRQVFGEAFERLCASLEERDDDLGFDDYAATSPSEFFAVCVEYFFVSPHDLREIFPEVHTMLTAYFAGKSIGCLRADHRDRHV